MIHLHACHNRAFFLVPLIPSWWKKFQEYTHLQEEVDSTSVVQAWSEHQQEVIEQHWSEVQVKLNGLVVQLNVGHLHTHTHIHTYKHTQILIYMKKKKHICVYVCECVWEGRGVLILCVCACVCACVRVRARVYMHTLTHTQTHLQAYADRHWPEATLPAG